MINQTIACEVSMHNVAQLKTKVQRWAEEITSTYGASVAAIIAVGDKLIQAKAECSPGEWGELTGETTGKPLLPFSARTARRLKAIASNAAFSNRAHAPDLPASWYTLAVLASLDPDDIEAAIADGVIHPEMERKDAEALKARITGHRPAPPPPVPPPALAEVVPITAPSMSAAERAAWDEGLREGGQMIAAFAERQEEYQRIKEDLAQQPEHQEAAALYRDILAKYEALHGALDQAAKMAYFDEEFWGAAWAHTTRILKQLENLRCK
jgi:hypothetical protein